MGLVLKTDTAMLKGIEKIPVWHFPYILTKKNQYGKILKHLLLYLDIKIFLIF